MCEIKWPMRGAKKGMKDWSYLGLETNSPADFLDYSYYHPKTKDRIETAAEKFLMEIAGILDDNRAEAKKAVKRICAWPSVRGGRIIRGRQIRKHWKDWIQR